MSEYPVLEFNKAQNPKKTFDFVRMEQLLNTTYKDHSPFNFHQIDFFVFLLYKEGVETHTVDFKEYECKQGTLLAIRKGQIHKFSNANPKGYALVFNYEFLGSIFAKEEAQKSLLLFNEFLYEPKMQLSTEEYRIILNVADQIKSEYFSENDVYSTSIIRSLLQVFVNQLHRFKATKQIGDNNKKYLADFIKFQNMIEQHYTQTLKVRVYANWLGIQTKQLNVITKNVINKTAKEFIDEVCINNIKRALSNTDKTIKEICYSVGFEETTNFNNYFKKRVGITPRTYRSQL